MNHAGSWLTNSPHPHLNTKRGLSGPSTLKELPAMSKGNKPFPGTPGNSQNPNANKGFPGQSSQQPNKFTPTSQKPQFSDECADDDCTSSSDSSKQWQSQSQGYQGGQGGKGHPGTQRTFNQNNPSQKQGGENRPHHGQQQGGKHTNQNKK